MVEARVDVPFDIHPAPLIRCLFHLGKVRLEGSTLIPELLLTIEWVNLTNPFGGGKKAEQKVNPSTVADKLRAALVGRKRGGRRLALWVRDTGFSDGTLIHSARDQLNLRGMDS